MKVDESPGPEPDNAIIIGDKFFVNYRVNQSHFTLLRIHMEKSDEETDHSSFYVFFYY